MTTENNYKCIFKEEKLSVRCRKCNGFRSSCVDYTPLDLGDLEEYELRSRPEFFREGSLLGGQER